MKPVYNDMLSRNDMFVGELLNRGDSNKVTRFFPSYKFMGCHKKQFSYERFNRIFRNTNFKG